MNKKQKATKEVMQSDMAQSEMAQPEMAKERKRIAFFDAKDYDEKFFRRENEHYGYDLSFFQQPLNDSFVEDFSVICIFVNDRIDSNLAQSLYEKGVQLLALRSSGYNHIDFQALKSLGIRVVRVPSYSPSSIAEHAMALLLTLNRHTHRAYYRTRDHNFSIRGLLGYTLEGKTLGVLGTGKIGQALIRVAHGFGMKILAFDLYPNEEIVKKYQVEYLSLDELYSRSDIITLHCPLTSETHHLINEASITRMKDGVTLINTSRGKLIDTKALISALKRGKILAVGLDVYEEEEGYFFQDWSENLLNDDLLARLLTFPNVLITSHQAFFTREALEEIASVTMKSIHDFFEGKSLWNEIL